MSNRKKKILYVMHCPWDIIKQRPQFIAEGLSSDYQIDVVYQVRVRQFKKLFPIKIHLSSSLCIKKFFVLPLDRIPFVWCNTIYEHINSWLFKSIFKIRSYDIVYITNHISYTYIRYALPGKTVLLYDCMDDEQHFPNIKSDKIRLRRAEILEKEILARADAIICSSAYLETVLHKRTGIKKNIEIINNALEIPSSDLVKSRTEKAEKVAALSNAFVYIGAIAEWFDFEALLYALEVNSTLTFILIGPLFTSVPVHERLIALGSCEHREIWSIMKKADALIMPFLCNQLIRSVNPVKLYEYIWAQKPVLVIEYEETRKFADYVYLYSSKEEFARQCQDLIRQGFPVKNPCKDVSCFLEKNTWEARVKKIKEILIETIEKNH